MELVCCTCKGLRQDKKLLVHEFATAFPVLRHVHAKITVLIVLVLRKVVKMMTIVMTILVMMKMTVN